MSFQGCDGAELLDWLFDQYDSVEKLEWLFDPNDSNLRHEGAGNHGNHHIWPVSEGNVCETIFLSVVGLILDRVSLHASTNTITSVYAQQTQHATNQADSDFLNALLTGSDSVSGSPLWSPNPSDSGISEDPPSDQVDSPQRPDSPQGDAQYFAPRPLAKKSPDANFPTDLSELRLLKHILSKVDMRRYEVIPLSKFWKKF